MPRLLTILAVLVAVVPMPTLADEAENAALWEAHVTSIVAKDVDAIVSRFSEDAVIVTPDGTYRAGGEIRAYYEAYVAAIDDTLLATVGRDMLLTAGEMLNYQYHYTYEGLLVRGFDSVHFEDGKITYLGNVEWVPPPAP